MGDTACVVHGFPYASAIFSESLQGNTKHALGESISFGRFITDQSLSWEKWSAFSSHKKYVEEAERYSQPGSVARKKAFFEAHYKRIAAQKAANASQAESKSADDDYNASVDVKMEKVDEVKNPKQSSVKNVNEHTLDALIENSPKDGGNIHSNASRSKKISSSKSLRALLNLAPSAELDRDPIFASKCSAVASVKVVSSYAEPTSQSENRLKVPVDPLTAGSKTGAKWRIFSIICSKSSTASRNKLQSPISSAKKRKQDKAGKQVKKLSCSFCFKAQPLLDSYENGENTRDNKVEKTLVPTPPPPPTSSTKNSASDNTSK